jgi:hypothetical protein
MFFKKVLIMMSKLATALVFGAFIGVGGPAFGITPETSATVYVQQEEPGWLGKGLAIGGKIVENGKDKWAKLVDPDIEVRQLRYKNAELERRVLEAERRTSDKQVMQALDYNQAMMCLGNIESLLKGYRPTILNPATSVGTDRAVTADQLTNEVNVNGK